MKYGKTDSHAKWISWSNGMIQTTHMANSGKVRIQKMAKKWPSPYTDMISDMISEISQQLGIPIWFWCQNVADKL